jgi:hypothetical protein
MCCKADENGSTVLSAGSHNTGFTVYQQNNIYVHILGTTTHSD